MSSHRLEMGHRIRTGRKLRCEAVAHVLVHNSSITLDRLSIGSQSPRASVVVTLTTECDTVNAHHTTLTELQRSTTHLFGHSSQMILKEPGMAAKVPECPPKHLFEFTRNFLAPNGSIRRLNPSPISLQPPRYQRTQSQTFDGAISSGQAVQSCCDAPVPIDA